MGVTRMGKTTIFLADDDEGVRRTLRTFFEGLPGYRVVGEACDGMEAVEGCRASAPDVALLDIQMPLLDGVSVARQVLADRAAKCVIILTAFSDREHIERVQACGAAGYQSAQAAQRNGGGSVPGHTILAGQILCKACCQKDAEGGDAPCLRSKIFSRPSILAPLMKSGR